MYEYIFNINSWFNPKLRLELNVDYFYNDILPILKKMERGEELTGMEQSLFNSAERIIGHEYGHFLGLNHPIEEAIDAMGTEREEEANEVWADKQNIMMQSRTVDKVGLGKPQDAKNIHPHQIKHIIESKVENAEREVVEE